MQRKKLLKICNELITAYKKGLLGQTVMPEDFNPGLEKMDPQMRISYFSLPMALNYQRDSYKLWEAALKTFNDKDTRFVFDVSKVANTSTEKIRAALLKHKLALQPNKHINSWITISIAVNGNWGTFGKLFESVKGDFLLLKKKVTMDYKKEFPYLSGPKIFNYWSFIVNTYGGVKMTNKEYMEIAPDTHITQCSIKLGVITKEEAKSLPRESISVKWRQLLSGSGINPMDMHPPLWFWSKNGFIYEVTYK
ncbi:hypothetical protein C4572_00480 [Candidatus Parcubacteria bacterium]|nr:MAG: hypothetical protein C4572_00480 [Candidatus Parcubacteria bacterium]